MGIIPKWADPPPPEWEFFPHNQISRHNFLEKKSWTEANITLEAPLICAYPQYVQTNQ